MSIDLDDPQLVGMFAVVHEVAHSFKVDYFIIGAMARDIQLSAQPGLAARRKTNDIDIAILIDTEEQFNQIRAALIATGEFEQADNNPIKLIYKQSIELDILPFGEIENEDRRLELNKGVLSMDMTGFKEVYPFIETHQVAENVELQVCPLEGLVLLKLISNDADPERTKDITDIEHLIGVYFDLNDTDIYGDHMDVMEMYNPKQTDYLKIVSAHVIGRKMKALLQNSEETIQNLSQILSRRSSELWQAMLEGLNN